MVASILKPPLKRPVLFVGEGRVEVVDRDVGRGDQHRLGMSERVEAILAVVVAHPSGSIAQDIVRTILKRALPAIIFA
jgi:hypothetical protein